MVDGTNRLSNGECVTKPWVTWLTGRVKTHKLTNIKFLFFLPFPNFVADLQDMEGQSGGEGGPPLFTPNEDLVTTLMSLSFTRNAAIKVREAVCVCCNNSHFERPGAFLLTGV